MVIDNKFFKRRDDVRCFLEDNVNVFKVTYFKEYGKYYTEEYYELTHDYRTGLWEFPDHFRAYCKDYKSMFAVIEFNDNHKYGCPFLILTDDRK